MKKAIALKKFIKDYSLLSEEEVEGVKIWDGYLVYACALDGSNEIDKLFNKIFGKEIYKYKVETNN